jgi:phage FluMu gp28-like protein
MSDAPKKSAGLRKSLSARKAEAKVKFRKYQEAVFLNRTAGIVLLHWSRQIGKSFTLAAWSVDRLLSQLQTNDSWLVTVLSNSKDNGAEFVLKCQEVCNKMGVIMESEDQSPDIKYENMRMEVRIIIGKKIGRIKVLAANPRTARGFSGDLVLDEFAFHEDSAAIWDAASPILDANPGYLCVISSTGNGKHNMFYRMASGPGPNDGTFFTSVAGFTVSRVTRTEAHKMGVKIYDLNTRQPITPEESRRKALDKRSYDQNYECAWADENMTLLTHELVSAAEREGITVDEQHWTPASIARMYRAEGILDFGQDFARNEDLSVQCVIERKGQSRRVIAMLRMRDMRTPDQQKELDIVAGMPRFNRAEIDMTGNGLGIVEYAQEKWGAWKIRGVNFATKEAINDYMRQEGKRAETAPVPEIMASDLLGVFESRAIEIPNEPALRADLLKPEKITSPGGRVSICAVRDGAGHADHFWAIALAIRSGMAGAGPVAFARIEMPPSMGHMGMGKLSQEVPL